MKSSRPIVKWLDRHAGPPAPFYCLVQSEAQYLAAMKHLGVTNPGRWLATDRAHATTHLFNDPKGRACAVVALGDTKGRSLVEVYGLLIHEAVHIWQDHCENIGETRSGKEYEAYVIQWLAQQLLEAYNPVHMKEIVP